MGLRVCRDRNKMISTYEVYSLYNINKLYFIIINGHVVNRNCNRTAVLPPIGLNLHTKLFMKFRNDYSVSICGYSQCDIEPIAL